MKTLIVGMGEVGSALYRVLRQTYDCWTKDLEDKEIPPGIEIMHVCIRYCDSFHEIVWDYIQRHGPRIVDICTTCPPGTTERLKYNAVHSTTRGLHPNLDQGLQTIKKHVGGPKAEEVKQYFEAAGIPCVTHRLAKTTELAHLLSNAAYGIQVMYADEMARICRQYGVDYYEAVMKYGETSNDGYRKLDQETKCRMILTPPNGKIGGHCVKQSAQMLTPLMNEAGVHVPMSSLLASFGDEPIEIATDIAVFDFRKMVFSDVPYHAAQPEDDGMATNGVYQEHHT